MPINVVLPTPGAAAICFMQAAIRRSFPYPCAVVEPDDIAIHLFSTDGFDPATSYGSAIITVAKPGERHETFNAGLRVRYGKVPINGIPRILRPRRKAGTATGFWAVDVGSN